MSSASLIDFWEFLQHTRPSCVLATARKTIPYSKDLPGEDFPQCEREHIIVELESHSSVRCEVDLGPGSVSAWHIAWSHGHEALTTVECTGHLTYQWLRALHSDQNRRFQCYMLETVAGLSLTSPVTAPRVDGVAIMSEPALADSGRQAHPVNTDWSRATDSSYIHSPLFKWRTRPSTKTYPEHRLFATWPISGKDTLCASGLLPASNPEMALKTHDVVGFNIWAAECMTDVKSLTGSAIYCCLPPHNESLPLSEDGNSISIRPGDCSQLQYGRSWANARVIDVRMTPFPCPEDSASSYIEAIRSQALAVERYWSEIIEAMRLHPES